jgi:hypothetical protein
MLTLQRAIFLRGVFDPADPSRITTTLYRPKHMDLRFEDGFVRAGDLLVPLDNVVELKSIPRDEGSGAPACDVKEDPNVSALVAQDAVEAAETVEEPVIRRRGRPRKNPSGEGS